MLPSGIHLVQTLPFVHVHDTSLTGEDIQWMSHIHGDHIWMAGNTNVGEIDSLTDMHDVHRFFGRGDEEDSHQGILVFPRLLVSLRQDQSFDRFRADRRIEGEQGLGQPLVSINVGRLSQETEIDVSQIDLTARVKRTDALMFMGHHQIEMFSRVDCSSMSEFFPMNRVEEKGSVGQDNGDQRRLIDGGPENCFDSRCRDQVELGVEFLLTDVPTFDDGGIPFDEQAETSPMVDHLNRGKASGRRPMEFHLALTGDQVDMMFGIDEEEISLELFLSLRRS